MLRRLRLRVLRSLFRELDRATAATTELDSGRKRGPASGARDDRARADRAPAVAAEVGAPGKRGTALAPRAAAASRRQQGVELLEALLERDEVGAALGYELDAKPVPPEHLEDEAAEVADPLLALAQERSLLALERRGIGGASRRLASGGARAPASAEGPRPGISSRI